MPDKNHAASKTNLPAGKFAANAYLRSSMQFARVIGHKALKERLITNAKEGRVSHAQLFLGPEGSGALAMALAYAQYLVCENPHSNDSCGECPACIKAAKLVHPDISFSYPVAPKEKISKPKSVDFINEWRAAVLRNPYLSYQDWVEELDIENKQGLISIEEARNIISRLSLKSVERSHRIVMMWYAEKMNTEAANCLLKILEEPEEKTIFILIAEQDEKIPLTILSRTQLVKINRLTDDELYRQLSSETELDSTQIRKVVHRSEGNYRMAQQILEVDDPDADMSELYLEWMRACLKVNMPKLQSLGEQLSSVGRERQKVFMEYCLQIVRECLLLNYSDGKLVRLGDREREQFTRFAPFIHQGNADGFVTAFNDAHYHIERNANFKILFTDLSFRIFHLLNVKQTA